MYATLVACGRWTIAPPTFPPLHGDEALGLEDAQRLPDGRQADPELVEQLVLLGEQGAVGQLARQDPTA